MCPAKVAPQSVEIVRPRLHAREQRIEARDVDARRVVARLERLHERRARARERIEDTAAGRDMPLEKRLDELWDELAEVRMEAVDVLRSLALGQRRLGPGELEVVLLVQGFLGGRHDTRFAAAVSSPRSPVLRAERWRSALSRPRSSATISKPTLTYAG